MEGLVKAWLQDRMRDGTMGQKEHRALRLECDALVVDLRVLGPMPSFAVLSPHSVIETDNHIKWNHMRTERYSIRLRITPKAEFVSGKSCGDETRDLHPIGCDSGQGACKRRRQNSSDNADGEADHCTNTTETSKSVDVADLSVEHIMRLVESTYQDLCLSCTVAFAISDVANDQLFTNSIFVSYAGNIFRGKIASTRHEKYRKKGKSRANLKYEIKFGQFTERQQEAMLLGLTNTFCKKGEKYLQYVCDVLYPETMIRVAMMALSLSYKEAEGWLSAP